MSRPIEDYALISDCHSAALVSKDGAIDWLAFPAFDSAAFLAGLLGDDENGTWRITPASSFTTKRHYIEGTMVLETIFTTQEGSCKLIDCIMARDSSPTLIRTVEGIWGTVDLQMELVIRFDYGSIIPWVQKNSEKNGLHAVAGPDALVLYSPFKMKGKNFHTETRFRIHEEERKSFTLMWYPSHESMPRPLTHPWEATLMTIDLWKKWDNQCSHEGFDKQSVKRSLLTLKGLIYHPTGAVVAAPTTSLPECIGGQRNWDYRYSWLRDSSFTLFALVRGGYKEEAIRWQDWLHRAVAGTPSQVNIMYGLRGERRLTEIELTWLHGYDKSRPVRIGNAAHEQFQLDVFGEILSTANVGWKHGIPFREETWKIQSKMIEFVCDNWNEPDEGIWEVRGPRRQFTHSKLMAWVALNCAIQAVQFHGAKGDIARWTKLRDHIHHEICDKGFNRKLNSFVQSYGSTELDASLLMMNHVGFLPPNDPKMVGTVEAIKKNLLVNGHVLRYHTESSVDGLPGKEGSFIACSFWLVDSLMAMGKKEEALEHYFAIQKIRNDVGLYAEEYSIKHRRMVGNFPQAFSHIAEVVSAMGIQEALEKEHQKKRHTPGCAPVKDMDYRELKF